MHCLLGLESRKSQELLNPFDLGCFSGPNPLALLNCKSHGVQFVKICFAAVPKRLCLDLTLFFFRCDQA
jgi:hypothetical protein